MNILLVTDKPSASRRLAPYAQAFWPDAVITFVHAVPYGNLRFDYPRGFGMSAYPFLSPVCNKLSMFDTWVCPPLQLMRDGTLEQRSMSRELLGDANLVVFAGDPDSTGAVAFEVLLQELVGADFAMGCPALKVVSFDGPSVERAFAEMGLFGDLFADELSYGRAKRYFDWNWNVNGLVVLGKTMRDAGVSETAPPLSKFALQLLYALRDQAPMREGEILDLMQHWSGTGRDLVVGEGWRPRLGSCASTVLILENLINAGLVCADRNEVSARCVVSDLGHRLLSRLHPDCEDRDLPFRLHAWCEQGEASKPSMDRYIRTFFGKQKRFQR